MYERYYINFLLNYTGNRSHIRLISSDGTPSASEGNLQMFINNKWITLCYYPSYTDMLEAACKLLGYAGLQDLKYDLNNQ